MSIWKDPKLYRKKHHAPRKPKVILSVTSLKNYIPSVIDLLDFPEEIENLLAQHKQILVENSIRKKVQILSKIDYHPRRNNEWSKTYLNNVNKKVERLRSEPMLCEFSAPSYKGFKKDLDYLVLGYSELDQELSKITLNINCSSLNAQKPSKSISEAPLPPNHPPLTPLPKIFTLITLPKIPKTALITLSKSLLPSFATLNTHPAFTSFNPTNPDATFPTKYKNMKICAHSYFCDYTEIYPSLPPPNSHALDVSDCRGVGAHALCRQLDEEDVRKRFKRVYAADSCGAEFGMRRTPRKKNIFSKKVYDCKKEAKKIPVFMLKNEIDKIKFKKTWQDVNNKSINTITTRSLFKEAAINLEQERINSSLLKRKSIFDPNSFLAPVSYKPQPFPKIFPKMHIPKQIIEKICTPKRLDFLSKDVVEPLTNYLESQILCNTYKKKNIDCKTVLAQKPSPALSSAKIETPVNRMDSIEKPLMVSTKSKIRTIEEPTSDVEFSISDLDFSEIEEVLEDSQTHTQKESKSESQSCSESSSSEHNILEDLELVFVSAQNMKQSVSQGGAFLIECLKPAKVHWINYNFLQKFEDNFKFWQIVIDGDTIVFINNPAIFNADNPNFEDEYCESAKQIFKIYCQFTKNLLFIMIALHETAPTKISKNIEIVTMNQDPLIQQSTVYSYQECAYLVNNLYIPETFEKKSLKAPNNIWKDRQNLEKFLSPDYEISIRCKTIIPLNAIGKYYFLEKLNSINIDHHDELSLDLFSSLIDVIDKPILEKAIETANRILFGSRISSETSQHMPRISAQKSIPLRRIVKSDFGASTISEEESSSESDRIEENIQKKINKSRKLKDIRRNLISRQVIKRSPTFGTSSKEESTDLTPESGDISQRYSFEALENKFKAKQNKKPVVFPTQPSYETPIQASNTTTSEESNIILNSVRKEDKRFGKQRQNQKTQRDELMRKINAQKYRIRQSQKP
ncbi:unnamed protein product [Moneuplotes crassus]|uniref:Uncharacterized protein n=1 Tax=Euplotes crassus TaxID=5936 RepID=A0AAD1UP11_EUPCR|nr:unnamed protein product [Moneuplotes crassus]